jgi:hypothetical protein
VLHTVPQRVAVRRQCKRGIEPQAVMWLGCAQPRMRRASSWSLSQPTQSTDEEGSVRFTYTEVRLLPWHLGHTRLRGRAGVCTGEWVFGRCASFGLIERVAVRSGFRLALHTQPCTGRPPYSRRLWLIEGGYEPFEQLLYAVI